MNKRVINKIKFYTNSDDTKTIVFLPYGRLFKFSTSQNVSSLDLAISILLFSTKVNQNNTLSHYEASLEQTKVG